MTELQTFDFPVTQFSEAGKALLTLAVQHPTWFAVYSTMISTGIILIVIPRAIGFCTTGSTKGSAASRWQSSIGNVQARSPFAMVQSLSMTGTLMVAGGGMVVAGVVGLGSAVSWGRGSGVNLDLAKDVDLTQAVGLVRGLIEQWREGVGLAFEQLCTREAGEWVGDVDWRGVAQDAESVGREGLIRAEERIRNMDWEGAGEGIRRVFAWF